MAEESTTNTGKVMDVQAPAAPAQAAAAPVTPSEPTTDSVAVEPTTTEAPSADSSTGEASNAEPTTEPATPAAEAATDAATPPADNAGNKPALGTPVGDKTPHHHSAPLGPIIVAVIVALVLGGLTVYALKTKNPAAPTANTASTSKTATTVKSSDVSKTSDDVDSSLKQVNDTQDFNSNDLSNATLGI